MFTVGLAKSAPGITVFSVLFDLGVLIGARGVIANDNGGWAFAHEGHGPPAWIPCRKRCEPGPAVEPAKKAFDPEACMPAIAVDPPLVALPLPLKNELDDGDAITDVPHGVRYPGITIAPNPVLNGDMVDIVGWGLPACA